MTGEALIDFKNMTASLPVADYKFKSIKGIGWKKSPITGKEVWTALVEFPDVYMEVAEVFQPGMKVKYGFPPEDNTDAPDHVDLAINRYRNSFYSDDPDTTMCRFCFKVFSRTAKASFHEKYVCTHPGAKNHNCLAIGIHNSCPPLPFKCPGSHPFVKRVRCDAGKKRDHYTPRRQAT